MKKILKISLVVAAMIMAANGNASEKDFSIAVKKAEGKTVTFAVQEVDQVILSIYDLDNKLIHTERVASKGSLNRTYDLNALPEGTYFLVAESKAKVAKYEIEVANNQAVLNEVASSEVYKPTLINKDGLVTVNVLNTSKSPVDVSVYNEAGDLVYASAVVNDENVARVFDINKLPFEKYTFITHYDNDKVSETVVSAK